MDTSRTARAFLGLNAAFSLLTGIVLLLAAEPVAGRLFAEAAGWQVPVLRALGAGLVVFAAGVALAATDRHVTRAQVYFVLVLDASWIAGSAVLLLVSGDLFSAFGRWSVVAVAGAVAIFALGQYVGARRLVEVPSRGAVTVRKGLIRAHVSRSVDAPAKVVWRVMTDHPRYADVADNLSKVEVVSGAGLGMERRCYGPKGEGWDETCDHYDEGRAFGFRVHTEAGDYPYPLSHVRGRWSVEPEGGGARFAIDIEVRFSGNRLVRLFFTALATRKFRTVLIDLAEGWALRMEREARAPAAA